MMIALLCFLLLSPVLHALPGGFRDEQVVSGPNHPTDMVFLPRNEMLVTFKAGLMYYYTSTEDDFAYNERTLALDISNEVCTKTELGLVSVQIHPDFESKNRFIYLYYTYNKEGNCAEDPDVGPVNRLSRFELSTSGVVDKSSQVVLLETPRMTRSYHTGGKIEFGKDGYLYVSIGDQGLENYFIGQNPQTILGSMVRLTDTGGIPPDNPYAQDGVRCNATGVIPSGCLRCAERDEFTLTYDEEIEKIKCQEIYAIGLRNPWRLVMDPNSDRVRYYINDVGGSVWEEVSEGGDGFAGVNYGYPIREGPCARWETTNCDDYGDWAHPIYYWVHTGDIGRAAAITGGAFVPSTSVWPSEYHGLYIFSNFVEGTILILRDTDREECLDCKPAKSDKDVTIFHTYSQPIAMRFGPYIGQDTAALYYTSSNGQVRRIVYGSGPEAVITVSDTTVSVGTTIEFSGTNSRDPDGDVLTYEWDFDGDGQVDSDAATTSITYDVARIYTVTLAVKDVNGGVGRATVKINVLPDNTSTTAFELFQWKAQGCPSGYDFCGTLEFCQEGSIYGYRDLCLEDNCECSATSAPLIRLIPGKMYRVTLRNAGIELTNIHTHGLHIVGDGDSDDVIRKVSGGHCLDYSWDISSSHPGGTYWYHAHHHGLTERQVGGGAYGMLIVEDNLQLNPVLPSWATNELLLQVVLTPSGDLLGNGKPQEVIDMATDQWYRLRVSLVSTEAAPSNFTFAYDGTGSSCLVHKVAADGIWRSTVPGPASHSFPLTGVARADFAIRCTGAQGTFIPILFMDEFAATIKLGPSEPDSVEMEEWTPNRPSSLQDFRDVAVAENNKLTIGLGYDSVNRVEWDPSTPLGTIAFNEVHEWKLVGTDFHPLHIHLYHMQVVSPGGCGVLHEEGEFYDVISVKTDCTVRFKTADFGQRCVLHCHHLFHEDNGSMAWVLVDGPNMPTNTREEMEYLCPVSSFTMTPTSTPTASPTTSSLTSTPSVASPVTSPPNVPNDTPAPAPTADTTSSATSVVSGILLSLLLVLFNSCLG